MIDFTPVRNKEITLNDLAALFSLDDLRQHTQDMLDGMAALIADCADADVVFQPEDPAAEDHYATNAEEASVAWTLGHVIVHATASSEESAFLAAEMARGVEHHGRSRNELPWQSVTTLAQCRQRIEESRRMRLASFELWPDEPNLDLTYQPWPKAKPINAKGRFVMGLLHDDSHLEQIAEIVRQAHTARQLPQSSQGGCGQPGCE
jgi:hypothetical protein